MERRNEIPWSICCRMRIMPPATGVRRIAFWSFCGFKDNFLQNLVPVVPPRQNPQKTAKNSGTKPGTTLHFLVPVVPSHICIRVRDQFSRILLGSWFEIGWKRGLRVPRGRLQTLDSTLSGSAVSVHVHGPPEARQSRKGAGDAELTGCQPSLEAGRSRSTRTRPADRRSG